MCAMKLSRLGTSNEMCLSSSQTKVSDEEHKQSTCIYSVILLASLRQDI